MTSIPTNPYIYVNYSSGDVLQSLCDDVHWGEKKKWSFISLLAEKQEIME